ncbi:MAG: PrsW family intramembrane metalloprotease [Candidatus Thermoplasmatota archaeon]|nr:PrsW family intramembrane metalloprotease [Candidatus Thermoplasmatota archaeon]
MYEKPPPPPADDQELEMPKLSSVLSIQITSLILTIILAMVLFFLELPLIYYLVGILLTGPIYAMNLPFLLRLLTITRFETNKRINRLSTQAQKTIETDRNGSQTPPNNDHRSISSNYILNTKLQEAKKNKPIISKGLLIISFLTPVWPIAFYYSLYKISKKIQDYNTLKEEIYSLFPEGERSALDPQVPSSSFKPSLNLMPFFAMVAIISTVGFGITFYIAGVGFFAIFWTVLVYNSIAWYTDNGKKGTSHNSANPQKKKQLTYPVMIAALFFGATAGQIASFTNTLYGMVISPIGLVEPTLFILVLVSVVAPLVEETTKVSGFFLMSENSKFPLYGWVVLGVLSGLGFALLEDYVYFQRFFLSYPLKESLLMLLMRLSFPVHMIGSGLAGLGIGLWRRSDKTIHLVIFTFLAVMVHATYNFTVTVIG